MGRAISAISGSAAALLPFAGIRTFLNALLHEFDHDHYRPELHYMRGPGPAWRAKNGVRPAA